MIETIVLSCAAAVGVSAAAAYIFAIVFRKVPLRAASALALCSNLCALTLVGVGVALNSKFHLVLGLIFIMAGTVSLSQAGLMRRQERA